LIVMTDLSIMKWDRKRRKEIKNDIFNLLDIILVLNLEKLMITMLVLVLLEKIRRTQTCLTVFSQKHPCKVTEFQLGSLKI
jgi:hypothetical protein